MKRQGGRDQRARRCRGAIHRAQRQQGQKRGKRVGRQNSRLVADWRNFANLRTIVNGQTPSLEERIRLLVKTLRRLSWTPVTWSSPGVKAYLFSARHVCPCAIMISLANRRNKLWLRPDYMSIFHIRYPTPAKLLTRLIGCVAYFQTRISGMLFLIVAKGISFSMPQRAIR